MSRVDCVIANDGHHTQAVLPVVRRLKQAQGVQCRITSLCELRGLPSPVERYAKEGIPLDAVIPFRFRPSPASGTSPGQVRHGGLRHFGRRFLWNFFLRWRIRGLFATPPDLVVLPNDRAFPYGQLCQWLVKRGIPTLVLQEGIRFDTPAKMHLGPSGATAFAVWGETSRDYYRSRGEPSDRIHITGAPRFDELVRADWSEAVATLRNHLELDGRYLLFLSNPIDDLGYLTSELKIELIRRFVAAQTAFLKTPGSKLVVKLHKRENLDAIASALGDLALSSSVLVVQDVPLHPLLESADGAVVFASTVGLEALMLDVPLAVLEIPEHGFLHDFVRCGVATPLDWNSDLGEQVSDWLNGPCPAATVSRYLAMALANRGNAARAVADLIWDLLTKKSARASG